MFDFLFSGGFLGILGAIISRVADYKNKKLDIEISKLKFENERELRHIDERIMEAEWAGRNAVATTEGIAAMDVADSKSFQVSLTNEPKMYSNSKMITPGQNWMLVILDFIRGFIRPGLTAYLCILMSISYFKETGDEKAKIIETILTLTTTVCLWWFGTRSKDQKKK